jgi:hypothetical protein
MAISREAARLQKHIANICLREGIKVEYRTNGGRAWRRTKRISIAPVKSFVTYAVALHEIGHVLGRHPARKLDREAAAWEWARANALEWNERMEATMKDRLDSYARWFSRKWRRGVYIAPSSAFDLLRGEVLTMALPKASSGAYQ